MKSAKTAIILLLTFGPLNATEKYWIAHESTLIVVGNVQSTFTYPWFDGWHMTGRIVVDEALSAKQSRPRRQHLIEPFDCELRGCPASLLLWIPQAILATPASLSRLASRTGAIKVVGRYAEFLRLRIKLIPSGKKTWEVPHLAAQTRASVDFRSVATSKTTSGYTRTKVIRIRQVSYCEVSNNAMPDWQYRLADKFVDKWAPFIFSFDVSSELRKRSARPRIPVDRVGTSRILDPVVQRAAPSYDHR